MNIVITGSTGFIGKNLLNYLMNEIPSAKFIAIYNKGLPFKKNPRLKFLKINIEKKFNVNFINKKTTVIHLAWDHIPNYNTKKHKTVHLKHQKNFIRKILKKTPKALFVMGTCSEYGNYNKKFDEDSDIKPQNNYAEAKNLLRIYIKKIKPISTNFTWGRLFYVYGKSQPTHTLYGQYLKYKNNKSKIKKLIKKPNLELDYLNIRTVCKYIYALAFNNKNNNEVNICSGKKILLQNLVNKWSKKKLIYKKKSKVDFFYGSNNKLKLIINDFAK